MSEETLKDVTISDRLLQCNGASYLISDIKAVEIRTQARKLIWFFVGVTITGVSATIKWWEITIVAIAFVLWSLLMNFTEVVITTSGGKKVIASFAAFVFSAKDSNDAATKASALVKAVADRL
jgi:hypothetical protein